MDEFKVMYYLRDDGACGYYRVDLPIPYMAQRCGIPYSRIMKGDPVSKIAECTNADLCVIPRPNDPYILELLKIMQEGNVKVVVDHDDNMFEISPLSPHYQDFGTEEVKVETPQGVIDLWVDGKNINLKENRQRIDNFKRALEIADAVTVTTESLANVYREYNDNVYVLPNCVDMTLWEPLALKRDNPDEIRLFWAGGSSHYEDWLILKDVLPVILKKYPSAVMHIMGCKWDSTLQGCPPHQIKFHKWVPTPAYPYAIRIVDPDIALIPLQDTKFNRGKSPIKWIEQASLSVPSVTSYVTPYKEVYDGTNGAFVENNNPDAWISAVSYLIENRLDAAVMGGKAQETVRRNFSIDSQYHLWYDAYREIVNGH